MESLNNTLAVLSNHDTPFINSVNNLQVRHSERQIFVHPDSIDYLKTISYS